VAERAFEIDGKPLHGSNCSCPHQAERGNDTYDNIGDKQRRKTHCDIVTKVRPGSLRVIGGNVNNNVDTKLRLRRRAALRCWSPRRPRAAFGNLG
jgi:hypothetical protein